MFQLATMDDWLALVRRYGRTENKFNGLLKDYGVMACRAFIEDKFGSTGKETRILEMGHGFSPQVMMAFQEKHDVWGVDDDQGLKYFREHDWNALYQSRIVQNCPHVTLRRGLVGSKERPADLPEGYFDVVLSVSILEEVRETVLASIIGHAAALLKPGGWLIGTHDVAPDMVPRRLAEYLRIQEAHGLHIAGAPSSRVKINWPFALLEHGNVSMLEYQAHQPFETRKFRGHFTTLFTAARKARKPARRFF